MAKDITTTQEDFDSAGQAVFTTLANVAKMHPAVASNPVATGVIDVVFPMMGLAASRTAYVFLGDRVPRFSAGYAQQFANDPKRLAEHAEANKDNPSYHEILYRGFRYLQDAVAPEVIPVLGTLAAQYNVHGKRPDAHFRRMGRLLCDLEDGDLDDLRTLLRGVIDCLGQGNLTDGIPEVGVRIAHRPGEAREFLEAQLGKDDFRTLGPSGAARRVFFLLKREGFGNASGAGFMRQWNTLQSTESTIMMNFITTQRVRKVVDP